MKTFDFSRANDPIRRTLRLHSDGNLEAVARQPVDEILALNRAFHAEEVAQSTSLWNGRSMVKVASIPLAVIEDWMINTGMNPWKDPDALAKMMTMLDSSEYSAFRTAPGRLT